MKIAIISPILLDTPPVRYGGLERVNFDLSRGLLKRGHKVVIFASDDSQVPEGGHLVKMGKAKGTVNTDWVKVERDAYNIYDHSLDEFDIVHSSDWFGFPYLSKKRNPEIKVCHTHHGGLADNWWKRSPPPFKLNLIAISKWMQQVYQKQGFPSQVAYNPIDTDFYEFQEAKGERYLFLGRIDPIKGVHTAILIAQQAKVELDVVGGTSFVSDVQYVEQIKAMCDESQINFIGEVSQEDKLEYLKNAKGLIVCSSFGEPLGLMNLEALACGTPVFALRDGGIPEIVNETSGFICNKPEEMVDAISKIDSISSRACRERAEWFSIDRCSDRYEQLYQTILDGQEW